MIQVYEYFISHHMSKSFESLFGCVALPGCFVCIDLKTLQKISHYLFKETLLMIILRAMFIHCIKNLLSLGEDRYLTTLALKHFPKYRTKFTSDAVCKTYVPETWQVLLSQRRRWINQLFTTCLNFITAQSLWVLSVFYEIRYFYGSFFSPHLTSNGPIYDFPYFQNFLKIIFLPRYQLS